jgi:DNA-directed RNA polymerase specialized sigma subunit
MARSRRKKPPPPLDAPDHFTRDPGEQRAPGPRNDDEIALWTHVHQGTRGRDDAIGALAKRYDRIAASMAKSYEGRGIGSNELLDVARQALRIAVGKCLPDKIQTFPAFAKEVIQNDLVDLFREGSLCTHHEHDQNEAFEVARDKLGHTLGRAPTDDETYSDLDWSETERRNHVLAGRRRAVARIDRSERRAGEPHIDVEAPTASTMDVGHIAPILQRGIDALDEMSRRVVMQRYSGIDQPSQKAVAERMGLTEYRLRQVEAAALCDLNTFVANDESADHRGAKTTDRITRKEHLP